MRGYLGAMCSIAIAATIAAQPEAAAADVISGNELFGACTATEVNQRSFCFGFVIGVIEGAPYGVATSLIGVGIPTEDATTNETIFSLLEYCPPAGSTYRQSLDIVVAFMEDNPQSRHQSARSLIRDAFVAAYPCD